MNQRDKINTKIKKLNLAYRLIRRALRIIKHEFETDKNTDIDYYIWKFSKTNDKLQSFVYKRLESIFVEEEYQKLVKRLKKPDKKEEE